MIKISVGEEGDKWDENTYHEFLKKLSNQKIRLNSEATKKTSKSVKSICLTTMQQTVSIIINKYRLWNATVTGKGSS